jgi:hypothetical protein
VNGPGSICLNAILKKVVVVGFFYLLQRKVPHTEVGISALSDQNGDKLKVLVLDLLSNSLFCFVNASSCHLQTSCVILFMYTNL